MRDRRIHMKVNIKSLAAEARIIRNEERKAKLNGDYDLLNSLSEHRKGYLRKIARESHIAYGFIRGVPYKVIEPKAKEAPNWQRVGKKIESFGKSAHQLEKWTK